MTKKRFASVKAQVDAKRAKTEAAPALLAELESLLNRLSINRLQTKAAEVVAAVRYSEGDSFDKRRILDKVYKLRLGAAADDDELDRLWLVVKTGFDKASLTQWCADDKGLIMERQEQEQEQTHMIDEVESHAEIVEESDMEDSPSVNESTESDAGTSCWKAITWDEPEEPEYRTPSQRLTDLRIDRFYHYKPKKGRRPEDLLDLTKFNSPSCRTLQEFNAVHPSPLIPISVLKVDDPSKDVFFSTSYSYLGGVSFNKLKQMILQHYMPAAYHIFCSIVQENRPVHLYIDMDLGLKQLEPQQGERELEAALGDTQPGEVIDSLIELFVEFFESVYHRKPNLSGMHWETACNPKKLSLHSHVTTEAFVTYEHQTRFMRAFQAFVEDKHRETGDTPLCAKYVAKATKTNKNDEGKIKHRHMLDQSVYSKNRSFRLIHNRKPGKTPLSFLPHSILGEPPLQLSDEELLFRSMPSYSIDVAPDALLEYDPEPVKRKQPGKTGGGVFCGDDLQSGGDASSPIQRVVQNILRAEHLFGPRAVVHKCELKLDDAGKTQYIQGDCEPTTAWCPHQGNCYVHRHTKMQFSMSRTGITLLDFVCTTDNKQWFPQRAAKDDLITMFGALPEPAAGQAQPWGAAVLDAVALVINEMIEEIKKSPEEIKDWNQCVIALIKAGATKAQLICATEDQMPESSIEHHWALYEGIDIAYTDAPLRAILKKLPDNDTVQIGAWHERWKAATKKKKLTKRDKVQQQIEALALPSSIPSSRLAELLDEWLAVPMTTANRVLKKVAEWFKVNVSPLKGTMAYESTLTHLYKDALVPALNTIFTFIEQGPVVLVRSPDEVGFSWEPHAVKHFQCDLFSQHTIDGPEGVVHSIASIWLLHSDRVQKSRCVCVPPLIANKLGDDVFNTWTPFDVELYEPVDLDNLSDEHKKALADLEDAHWQACGGESGDPEKKGLYWYLDFCATLFKFTGKKTTTYPIFYGTQQGSGKTTTAVVMIKMIGNKHSLRVENIERDLFATHSGHMQGLVFVHLDDLAASPDLRGFLGEFKGKITGSTQGIRSMNKELKRGEASYENYQGDCNHTPIMTGERRDMIFRASTKYVGNTEFWTNLYDKILHDKVFIRAWYQKLMARTTVTERTNLQDTRPVHLSSVVDMAVRSAPDEMQFLVEKYFTAPQLEGATGEKLTASVFLTSYNDWRAQREWKPKTSTAFAMRLKDLELIGDGGIEKTKDYRGTWYNINFAKLEAWLVKKRHMEPRSSIPQIAT